LFFPFTSGLGGLPSNNLVLYFYLFLILGGIAYLFLKIKTLNDCQKRNTVFLFVWFYFPVIAATLLKVYIPKYYSAFYPALFLIIAFIINGLWKEKKIIINSLILIFFLITSTGTLNCLQTKYICWSDFINFIENKKTNNSIILMPFNEVELFKKYYHGQIKIADIYFGDKNLNTEEKILKYNYVFQTPDEPQIDNWLKEQTQGKDKIFLMEYNTAFAPLTKIMKNNGWKLLSKKQSDNLISLQLKEYVKTNN